MKNFFNLVLILIFCFSLCVPFASFNASATNYNGAAKKDMTTGADIRAMSFNTLVDNDAVSGFNWGTPQNTQGVNRFENGAAVIAHYKPDVIALQECTKNWHIYFRNNLSGYDIVNVDVPSNSSVYDRFRGMKDTMCTTIMYNKTKLELVHNEIVAYSEDSYGDLQGMRYASAAVFKIKSSGQKFIFSSTHPESQNDERAKGIRKKQMGELAAALNRLKQEYSCPIVAGGDYNSTYNEEPLSVLRSTVNLDCATENKSVMTIVQGGFDINGTATKGIDFLFYSNDAKCKYFAVIEDIAAKQASDHRPIIADIDFKPYSPDTTSSVPASTTSSKKPTSGTPTSSNVTSSSTSESNSVVTSTQDKTSSNATISQTSSNVDDTQQTVDGIPKANDGKMMVIIAIVICVVALAAVGLVVFLLIKK